MHGVIPAVIIAVQNCMCGVDGIDSCLFLHALMLQPSDYNVEEKIIHKFMVQMMYAPPEFKLEDFVTVVSLELH